MSLASEMDRPVRCAFLNRINHKREHSPRSYLSHVLAHLSEIAPKALQDNRLGSSDSRMRLRLVQDRATGGVPVPLL
jgi:hypothetical protein